MKNVLLVCYGEIALRGDNRKLYEKILIYNIRRSLKKFNNFWVQKEQGRFLIETEDDLDYDYFIPNIIKVFGVVSVLPCVKTNNQNIQTLMDVALDHMREFYPDKNFTFKVITKRSNKNYPMLSNDVSAEVGHHLLDNMPNLRVDVHNPDVRLRIELRNHAYIYSKTIKGPGGLPVGSGGKATLLLSGGIDSPVAGFMTARRGVLIEAVYFHSPPYTSGRAKQKVIDLVEKLAEYIGCIKLYIVNFSDIQTELRNNVKLSRLTILLKRTMLKVSERIAETSGASALVTGDSIGQVASQTLESMLAIDSAVSYPVLRPLASFDKNDIVKMAKEIGTFDISIRPYEDCCTIFVAEHPETKPKRNVIENIEADIENLEQLIESALNNIEIMEIGG